MRGASVVAIFGDFEEPRSAVGAGGRHERRLRGSRLLVHIPPPQIASDLKIFYTNAYLYIFKKEDSAILSSCGDRLS